MAITLEQLQADATGEMVMMRQYARLWLASCNDEEMGYQDRETLRSFDKIADSELLNLAENLAENMKEIE